MAPCVDRQFADPRLAELYDPLCGTVGRADFACYLPMVMAAAAVLDVGCGTGALLRLARERGHSGRLVGLDPAAGMLAVARRETGVEWVLGDLATSSWHGAFDLVVMTGHAFQVLLTDEEVHDALAAIRRAVVPGGVFAFETRNPSAREWETWRGDRVREFTDHEGLGASFAAELDGPIDGDLVRFTATYRRDGWGAPERSSSTLRFLSEPALDAHLDTAGLDVVGRFGDWDRTPVTASSPEIITQARSARGSTSGEGR